MFGSRLRELRKQKKLTMKQLGEKFNLAESTISGYEIGNRKPDMEIVKNFADFFDVSVDYLLGRTNNSNPSIEDELDKQIKKMMNDPETSIFFKGYLDAPEEKKKQMRDFMQFILEQEKDRKPGDKQGE